MLRFSRITFAVGVFLAVAGISIADDAQVLTRGQAQNSELRGGESRAYRLTGLRAGETYRVQVAVPSGTLRGADELRVELLGTSGERLAKALGCGDPDFYLPYRPSKDGDAHLSVTAREGASTLPLWIVWDRQAVTGADQAALEAEPNDDWRHANPLVLGRDVYGTADDVDYLDNHDEGRAGLDWFRIDVADSEPILVYFQLDLLDRDVSANLRVFTVDAAGKMQPFETGKDPMEIVHDRERERYSKHISRTLAKGTYYLEVNANHPDYILRTRTLAVPPYRDPTQAVETGMHYIMNVGDAWFAQVPREGNIYVRAASIHDTGTRCTACHPSSFSTESNLVAHRNGYPIRSKSDFLYVLDRLYNSITPLYGDDGLYWQRFIAIPLQAQGKQGGIITDFEREVSGKRTSTFERFGPFLKAAWSERTDLPPDEQNGVVPLDSKFGYAWRDWRVLKEMATRTRRAEYAQAADNIAQILGDSASDKRIETLQDRIHRIYAWWLIDKDRHAVRIQAEIDALFKLQNDDGGWYELDSRKGPSAVYTTGQITWTLLKLGLSRDDARIARALAYLLAQQQPFGGWFQTTTHENFRTPMRETRYAVEALAEAYPRPGAPLVSWGNRDDGPARRPRTDSLVHLLDDLENLWDVPEAERADYARAIRANLDHPEPLVRAAAAACLGRLGQPESVAPLVKCLNDQSKIVWRSAAWALRRLGNASVGVDEILAALESTDPLTRRGAARIFAYQFYGMDERRELAYRLLALTDDPDVWTRLQALKTLRQWFYRTNDATLKRRIIYAYLARMAKPELPVIRKNLSEGLYIMLDENLGGGVSLHKNIATLPERMRPRILAARQEVERAVLITPVLGALESANDLQREAIVRAFDGSFFKGRFYARQPEAMLDVGNDREFGFLYDPPTDVLDRTFAAVFQRESCPEVRSQAIQLASFFELPGRTSSTAVQVTLLRALEDPDPGVRDAANMAVRDALALKGDSDEAIRDALRLLGSSEEARRAVVRALARSSGLVDRAEVRTALRGLREREDAAVTLEPVLSSSLFDDGEVVTILSRGWDRAREAAERLALLEVLARRKNILDVEEPAPAVQEILKSAVTDKSAAVRERTLTLVSSLPALWKGSVSTRLLLSALADDTPAIRLLGLKLSEARPAFWQRADAREHLLRLLVDPDARCRDRALRQVEAHRLIAAAPLFARRVKALAADSALEARASAALAAQGVDPASIVADLALARPRLLSLSEFRKNVNPLFYTAGEDGHACVECHANHTILRIAPANPGQGVSGDQLMTNYNSVLKVINLGEPESSLVLRKPMSPQGQGGPDPSSPTGLTHVGGPRWESAENPGYQALLRWIRAASTAARADAESAHFSTDSYSPGYEPALAGDGDLSTIWQTEFVGANPGYPHELVVDLGATRRVDGLLYVPRQDTSTGRVKDYEIRLSSDGKIWSEPVARGSWANDPTFKFVALPGAPARFVQLKGLSEVNGSPSMSAAEVVVDSSAIP